MAQVMCDRAILFGGQVYSVTQTWKEKEPIISATPANDQIADLEA